MTKSLPGNKWSLTETHADSQALGALFQWLERKRLNVWVLSPAQFICSEFPFGYSSCLGSRINYYYKNRTEFKLFSSLTSCVTSGKLFNRPESQFSYQRVSQNFVKYYLLSDLYRAWFIIYYQSMGDTGTTEDIFLFCPAKSIVFLSFPLKIQNDHMIKTKTKHFEEALINWPSWG